MPKKRTHQLAAALQKRRLVTLSHRFEPWLDYGYVLDVGPKFFLLSMVTGEIWFNGFHCFRIRDIRDLKPDTRVAFVEAALKRGERAPKKPRIKLASLDELLLSAGRAFPLVTIRREKVFPGACWIGRVLGVKHRRLSFLKIKPDATWDKKPTEYRLSEITRVSFGGDYENALHLVGGDPPAR